MLYSNILTYGNKHRTGKRTNHELALRLNISSSESLYGFLGGLIPKFDLTPMPHFWYTFFLVVYTLGYIDK